MDRRTAVFLVVVVLFVAALGPVLLTTNPTPGAGLYRVSIQESNPYYPVVEADPELQAVTVDRPADRREEVDVYVTGTEVFVPADEKGRAAARALREAVVAYNDRLMAEEEDEAAAFPVDVTLRYLPQASLQFAGGSNERPSESSTGDSNGDSQQASGSGSTGIANGEGRTDTGEKGTDRSGRGQLPSAPIGGIFGSEQTGTPASISPPFPLTSLLLAFLFLLPFNIIIQAYGSSVIAERINRRGEPLLVSPASRGDVVVGKVLPYFLLAVAITALIALAIGGGLLSVAAVTPLAALFLATTFLAGMLARSYKELTFVTVTISVSLTGYAFIPAVFAEVHPIAAISPLTLVVDDLQGTAVGWGEYVFATAPVALAAVVLFALGTGIYREEDMFTQRPLPQKALDALASPLRSRWRVGLWTALFIPFVLVSELFAVAILFVLPVSVSIPLLLGAVAVVEEIAKSIHVYAGFNRAAFPRSLRTAAALGAMSGIGFFVGEKVLLITQLVSLPALDLGRAAFAPEVLGIASAALIVAPLLLHVTTAIISAMGASRSRLTYLLGLGLAAVIHLAYNLLVVTHLA